MAKRIVGNADEAKKWITESSLQEENKNKLLLFVSQFSSLTFFKKEQRESAPAWLKTLVEYCLEQKQTTCFGTALSFLNMMNMMIIDS